MSATRRLAAILAADIAGYSRLVGVDEARTLQGFKEIRAELFDPKVGEHHGRVVKTTGDGFLVEFSSVVDALRCATEVQAVMAERNAVVSADNRIDFRAREGGATRDPEGHQRKRDRAGSPPSYL